MIPRRTVWAVGLCMLTSATICPQLARATPANKLPPADLGYTYEVLRHRVALPPGAYPARGCFVAAHKETLFAALAAQGLSAPSHACDSNFASCGALLTLSPQLLARSGDAARGVAPLSIRLSQVLPLEDGKSVWWVERTAEPEALWCGAARPDIELWPLLAEGTARLARATPKTTPGMQPGAPLSPIVVDLRHAAVELKLDVSAPPPTPSAALVCTSHNTLPPPVAVAAADSAIWHVSTHRKRLALTFDACSTYEVGRFNPEVIAALKRHQIPATLFIGGHWAEMFPDELEALAQEPLFELGNHTYSHPHMRDLPRGTQAQELLWTQQLIYARTGKLPRFFRPPYGEVDEEMLAEVSKAGLVTVEYDLPAGDASVHVSAARLSSWVEGQISPGSIVIMHMNRPGNHTAEALAEIARELRGRGYSFCRMSSLVDDNEEGCL